MRLVVVYGLKTADYGYLDQFYPTRRLKEECARRSIPLRFLFAPEVHPFLRESRSDAELRETVCLVRGTDASRISALLEGEGFRTVNPAAALRLAGDKLECARFLNSNGWPTPLTRLPEDPAPIKFPLVAKPRYGSRGIGVRLVHSEDELKNLEPGYILQEFIARSQGEDLRFFFTGGEVTAYALRCGGDSAFISNVSLGGSMTVPLFPEEILRPWKNMVLSIANKSRLWYGSVDFLFCDGRESFEKTGKLPLTVCEINGSPGFEALELSTSLNIAGILLDKLTEQFSRQASGKAGKKRAVKR